jgi:multidrug resistance protein, MATE family
MADQAINPLQVGITNRHILRMALPISVAILVPQVNFITNNIFLGHLNLQSLALGGITGVFYLIFAVIGGGLNNGLQALIARRSGENRVTEIGKLYVQGMRIVVLLSAAGILLTYGAAPWILHWSVHSEALSAQAIGFLKIRIWGLPFLYFYQLQNALLVGTNQSRFLIFGALAETAINIILDYGLIFGHFGLPAMGFNGAAVASIFAEFAGMLVVFSVIRLKGVRRKLLLNKQRGYDPRNARLILVQSSPLIFQYAISIGSWQFFYILIEHHGQRDLAISNAMRNIFGTCGAFTWAFASSTNAMVSNVIGQGKKELVIPLIKKIVRLSFSFAFLIAFILNIFPRTILSVYGQDAGFTEHAVPVIRVVSVAVMLMSFGTIWLNGVTGTGATRINLAIESFTIFFYCIYVYLVLEYFGLPIIYGWLSEWLYWTLSFVLSFAYIRSGRWRKKVI